MLLLLILIMAIIVIVIIIPTIIMITKMTVTVRMYYNILFVIVICMYIPIIYKRFVYTYNR